MMLWTLLSVCSLLLGPAIAEDCEPPSANTPTFNRTFSVFYKGPPFATQQGNSSVSNAIGVSNVIGSCQTPNGLAAKMTEYFSSYGLDMTRVRLDPFVGHTESGFQLDRYNDDQFKSQVYAGSHFQASAFMNVGVAFTEWAITAKRDSSGSGGTIKKGHQLSFGMHRFSYKGQQVCFEFRHKEPVDLSIYTTVFPIDVMVYNEVFREGAMRGLAIFHEDGTLSLTTFVTFPADLQ